MRFLFKLQRCLYHCHAERRERYKTIETLYDRCDLEVAEARLRTIDYIFAFMGSAIDLRYPFLEGGFKNNLPSEAKKCLEVFWWEYSDHGYFLGLRSASHYLNLSTNELKRKLDRIDAVMEFLAHSAVKAIMKAKTDREIMWARHFFEQNVVRNKEKIWNLR